MTGRRTAIGLSLISMLALWALTASSATALRGTTAYTCRPEPSPKEFTLGFEDEHCDKAILGTKAKFVHEEIKGTTSLKVTNSETQGQTSTPSLTFKAEGEEVEIKAGGFESCKGKTTVKNGLLGKQMTASGEFCGEFYNLVVAKPSKTCEVATGKIQLTAESFWSSVVVEIAKKEEMSVGFSAPKEKPYATFKLEKCPNPNLNKTYSVEGPTVFANVSSEVNSFIGATLTFNTVETGEVLTVGGEPAYFEGTFTPRMVPEVGVLENPVVLETTTS